MPRRLLQSRHRQAAIVARLCRVLFRGMRPSYPRKGSFAALFNDFYITMAILADDDHGKRPCTITRISKATELSRPTVRERTKILEQHGVILKAARGDGYVSNPAFFNGLDARVFTRFRDAIMAAKVEMCKAK